MQATNDTRFASIFVAGDPPTQGSKNVYPGRNGGRPRVVESMHDRLQAYRSRIYLIWRRSDHDKIAGAVDAQITYYLPRPKHHYSTSRKRPGAILPRYVDAVPLVKPDIDKLNRATFDALTLAGAIEDDARIVRETAVKLYADAPNETGVNIQLRPFEL